MLKVYVKPPVHLSQAMTRVANALERYAPSNVEIVTTPQYADFFVLHVIGSDAIPYVAERPNMKYAAIQYCYKTAGEGDWSALWRRAKAVWSYYDLDSLLLPEHEHFEFYHAPLGLDDAFVADSNLTINPSTREIGVMTSGYVSGPGAEAIEEFNEAAGRLDLSVVHLGPEPTGLTQRPCGKWRNAHGISDNQLALLYRSTKWVSGLRYIEGFELPALEGLACGARPIVFDRPEMRHWYGEHAVFVPECNGEDLVKHLLRVLSDEPKSVSNDERDDVIRTFDWERIVKGFWERATQ